MAYKGGINVNALHAELYARAWSVCESHQRQRKMKVGMARFDQLDKDLDRLRETVNKLAVALDMGDDVL